jgi:hypothetical protein
VKFCTNHGTQTQSDMRGRWERPQRTQNCVLDLQALKSSPPRGFRTKQDRAVRRIGKKADLLLKRVVIPVEKGTTVPSVRRKDLIMSTVLAKGLKRARKWLRKHGKVDRGDHDLRYPKSGQRNYVVFGREPEDLDDPMDWGSVGVTHYESTAPSIVAAREERLAVPVDVGSTASLWARFELLCLMPGLSTRPNFNILEENAKILLREAYLRKYPIAQEGNVDKCYVGWCNLPTDHIGGHSASKPAVDTSVPSWGEWWKDTLGAAELESRNYTNGIPLTGWGRTQFPIEWSREIGFAYYIVCERFKP